MKFEKELSRNNVTLSQFLAYVRHTVDKCGGQDLRSDLGTAYIRNGGDLNFDITHEDGTREKSVSKPCESQTYIKYPNGATYNEIVEFTVDNADGTGHGYYYLLNVHVEEAQEAAEATQKAQEAEEWAAESERVEAATLAALAPMIATEENPSINNAFLNTSDAQSAQEEAEGIQEDAAPVYLEERWPESNEAEGIWYTLEYAPGVPTIHHTVEALRTAIHQARHNGRQIKAAWRHDDNTNTRRAIIPETTQEKTDRENREHCQRISEELEEYAAGNVYKCPECGREHTWERIEETEHEDEAGWAVYTCPDCGTEAREEDWEQMGLYDYFGDCLDVEYRCGSDREYRSACIMIACGGPNIYIDTATKNVELYWWTDRATYPLSYDAAEAVDDWAREYWDCM